MRVIKDYLPVLLGPPAGVINQSLATLTWSLGIPLYLKKVTMKFSLTIAHCLFFPLRQRFMRKIALEQFSTYITENSHSTETLNIFVSDTILPGICQSRLKNCGQIILKLLGPEIAEFRFWFCFHFLFGSPALCSRK